MLGEYHAIQLLEKFFEYRVRLGLDHDKRELLKDDDGWTLTNDSGAGGFESLECVVEYFCEDGSDHDGWEVFKRATNQNQDALRDIRNNMAKVIRDRAAEKRRQSKSCES